MAEQRMLDLSTVIGVYTICNTGAVLVHAIDYGEDKVLASINGISPEWCSLTEEYMESTGDLELGFTLGSFFIPLCEVMRFYGGAN
ncbi:MAG: hypothetical protein J6I76_01485 [Oribacterium sp.]|nr:hypothetical protein [Oribacterium sp.]